MSYTATSGGDQESGVYKIIRGLGKAIAVGASILGTPAVFTATKGTIFSYLAKNWGRDFAEILTWIMAGVEAYIIYAATPLAFTAVVVWALASYAAGRFGGGGQ